VAYERVKPTYILFYFILFFFKWGPFKLCKIQAPQNPDLPLRTTLTQITNQNIFC